MARAYGEAHAPAGPGGLVTAVAPGSGGAEAGFRIGDIVTAVDETPVHDVIDWMWLTADTPVDVTVLRDGEPVELELHRGADQETGIEFSDLVFDGVRECDNACAFCFVAQLPPGLRSSLYVRDDDFRLSFLSGNFITLTNLTDDDMSRIVEQRLSPLYVSLHAVDAETRRSLVCAVVEDRAVDRVDELLAAGIDVHVQIVLVPGVNDGEVLQRSLAWLAERPGILSVGVVPLGYTGAQQRFSRSYERPEDAAAVIDALEVWQDAKDHELAERWVYAADEFYLAAGRELPTWDEYDGFPQYENGIGMVRAFTDELDEAVGELDGTPVTTPVPVGLISGELFAPMLASRTTELDRLGVAARVVAVPNRFLGGGVSVTGLLTGTDVLATLASQPAEGVYLLPDIVVNSDGLMLDDVPAAELAARAGRDVRLVPADAASLVDALQRIGSDQGAR